MQSTRLFAPAAGLFKGLVRAPVTAPVFGTTGQRFFSFTSTCQNEDTTKTPEAATEAATEEETEVIEEEAEPIKLSRRRRRFHEWANGSGAKYSRPAKGTTNYLGTSTVKYMCIH
jgi:hypothetical protein